MLLQVNIDSINGCTEEAEEWEEVEFLVDSGASATVVHPDTIKAVAATGVDPDKSYRLADGSIPSDPARTAASSEMMSPNVFSPTITSK